MMNDVEHLFICLLIKDFLSKRCSCFIINLGVSWMGEKLEDVLITQGRVTEALGQGKV